MFDFQRILRLKILNKPGILGKIADTIGNCGANLGNINIIKFGTKYRIRDIEVYTRSPNHFEQVLLELRQMKEIRILEVFDDVLKAHEGGMIKIKSKVKIDNYEKLEQYYLPGVAAVAKLVDEQPEKVYEYTNRVNTVGVVTNGSALLNFRNSGTEAAYVVMEALSAVLYNMVGVSAMPVVLETNDVEEFVKTIKMVYKTFGMIALEDISSSTSIDIEEKLQEVLDIPVIDTNRYGNAIVTLSALINISKKVEIDLGTSKVGILGFGSKAAGICRILKAYGIADIYAFDINPEARARMEKFGAKPVETIEEIIGMSNILIGTSRIKGLIKFGMVKKGQVILSLSKPDPEIEPEIAMKAGAAFAVDGKMVTPLLAVPGLIKGTIEARARKITINMMITAAEQIASLAKEGEILPKIFDMGLHEKIAEVVKKSAIDEGHANLWEVEIEEDKAEQPEDILKDLDDGWMVS